MLRQLCDCLSMQSYVPAVSDIGILQKLEYVGTEERAAPAKPAEKTAADLVRMSQFNTRDKLNEMFEDDMNCAWRASADSPGSERRATSSTRPLRGR